jgi:hypothetical protein
MNMHFTDTAATGATAGANPADTAAAGAQDIPDAVVGGGFIMLRRNSIGRLKAPRCPYEHGTRESAEAEAARMALLNPGTEYVVFEMVARQIVLAGGERAE